MNSNKESELIHMSSPGGRGLKRVQSARLEARQVVAEEVAELKALDAQQPDKYHIPDRDEVEQLEDDLVDLILEIDEYYGPGEQLAA